MRAIRVHVPLAELFGYATDLRSKTQGRASHTPMQLEAYHEVPAQIAREIIARVRSSLGRRTRSGARPAAGPRCSADRIPLGRSGGRPFAGRARGAVDRACATDRNRWQSDPSLSRRLFTPGRRVGDRDGLAGLPANGGGRIPRLRSGAAGTPLRTGRRRHSLVAAVCPLSRPNPGIRTFQAGVLLPCWSCLRSDRIHHAFDAAGAACSHHRRLTFLSGDLAPGRFPNHGLEPWR